MTAFFKKVATALGATLVLSSSIAQASVERHTVGMTLKAYYRPAGKSLYKKMGRSKGMIAANNDGSFGSFEYSGVRIEPHSIRFDVRQLNTHFYFNTSKKPVRPDIQLELRTDQIAHALYVMNDAWYRTKKTKTQFEELITRYYTSGSPTQFFHLYYYDMKYIQDQNHTERSFVWQDPNTGESLKFLIKIKKRAKSQ